MKITDERKENMKAYGVLHRGDLFVHNRNVYIKIYDVNDEEEDTFNAVNLENGDLIYFANEDVVELHDAELIIRG
jgi:hypothetical protein